MIKITAMAETVMLMMLVVSAYIPTYWQYGKKKQANKQRPKIKQK